MHPPRRCHWLDNDMRTIGMTLRSHLAFSGASRGSAVNLPHRSEVQRRPPLQSQVPQSEEKIWEILDGQTVSDWIRLYPPIASHQVSAAGLLHVHGSVSATGRCWFSSELSGGALPLCRSPLDSQQLYRPNSAPATLSIIQYLCFFSREMEPMCQSMRVVVQGVPVPVPASSY